MPDIVLDTNTIGDFLSQYFKQQVAGGRSAKFVDEGMLTRTLAERVNRILDTFRRYQMGEELESPYSGGIVVASTFAFVELCRKWERIVKARFSLVQLHAFLEQPPEWFDIAPVDDTLLPFYANIPTHVWLKGETKAIEWCDAIHAATADSRGRDCFLATTDQRLQAVPHLRDRIVI